ncbi:flagellar biosynthesis protein FlhF [Marinomonas sp. C2222]|uniref:Flagellar biosynthesis protein FlhF n=1 Tax=Marinomonas sargassi TaxID=2984494 RepID=A0ABT2YNC0_9GAMM|nr:flagellar biosynthesis protein FlhF [Marinomonas sargassi]MCV2401379.1 flagellar biosynthesis protein FlhF [Marinomonas sargassi]
MQIRRFRAPDMRQAIRKVRDAVGPDAVILSNQRLPTGEIEIVAALDYDGSMPTNISSKPKDKPSFSSKYQSELSSDYLGRIEEAKQAEPAYGKGARESELESPAVESRRPVKNETTSAVNNPESVKQLHDMELELKNVKAMLERSGRNEGLKRSAVDENSSRTERKLQGLGLSDAIVAQLMREVTLNGREDDWNRLLARLAETIPVASSSDELRGCIAFMGPTGVGKTTSIGKIAAQHVLKYGTGGVVLITTDTYRIAAHEQLRTFGRILNVPVEVVNEYTDLNDVLDKYADYSLVLVDTAGMNPRDSNLERQLLMMKRARANLKKMLVLPCTSQRQVLKSVVDVYSQVGLDGCVLSKLDESASLGEAVSVVVEEGLPVAYIADGQRIPDDIQAARAHNLISRVVYTAEHYSQLYGQLKYGS